MPTEVDAYLRRLGLGELVGAPPSVEGLRALHRAHTERVPYECLDIWLGRATTVDPVESVGRILRGRGGYCFHLNGAFAVLLESLGYRVTRHVGGVQRRGGGERRPTRPDRRAGRRSVAGRRRSR